LSGDFWSEEKSLLNSSFTQLLADRDNSTLLYLPSLCGAGFDLALYYCDFNFSTTAAQVKQKLMWNIVKSAILIWLSIVIYFFTNFL
jgi:hypothetical protein